MTVSSAVCLNCMSWKGAGAVCALQRRTTLYFVSKCTLSSAVPSEPVEFCVRHIHTHLYGRLEYMTGIHAAKPS